MSEPLLTYLRDHLGGAKIAVEVLETMRDQHDDPQFREFATALLPEMIARFVPLQRRLGLDPALRSKLAGGW
jgi:hypothetical protein